MAEPRKRKQRPSAMTYKCCPACGGVSPTAAFKRAAGTKPDLGPERQVACPACGRVAPIWAFRYADPPAGGDGRRR